MQTEMFCAKMVTVKDGWIICPRCGRQRIQPVLPTTCGTDLVVYCKRCRAGSVISRLEPEPERLRR